MVPYALEYNYGRTPYATVGLITVNAVMFPLIFLKASELAPLLTHADQFAPWQWLTSAFMHAGIEHLVGNMLFLWVYGRYVEERLGVARMLALYGLFIVTSALAFIGANFRTDAAGLGASGAISGLMGLVLVAAPTLNVRCFWWGRLGNGSHTFGLPAWFLLGVWVIEQSVYGLSGLVPGIAISAHLGGFFSGMAIGLLLRSDLVAGSDWHLSPKLSSGLSPKNEQVLEAEALAALHRAGTRRADREGPEPWYSRPVPPSRRSWP